MNSSTPNRQATWRTGVGILIAVAAAILIVVSFVAPRADETAGGMKFVSAKSIVPPAGDQTATLSGGCFWAMQAMFSRLKGVDKIEAGYAGGTTPNPTYEEVCTETTGYAETVQIAFDPKVISYRQLLTVFFHVHNPTTPNRQGDDIGTSYRSVIFYHNADQKQTAEDVIAEITREHVWSAPIVTQVVPYTRFYRAEGYHQDYFAHHPDQGYCQFVVAPKVAHFKDLYKDLLKPGA